MCLFFNKLETRKLKEKYSKRPNDLILVYKILEKTNKENVYKTPVTHTEVRHGEKLISDRRNNKLTKTDIESGTVEKGIHVYLNQELAYKNIKLMRNPKKYKVVPAVAKASNFVAVGRYDHAVFTRIQLLT